MHKKSIFFLIFSLLLILSIQSPNEVQAVTQATSPLNGVRMLGVGLQLQQNGTSFITTVNSSLNAKVANAQNNTLARFVASFVNENTTTTFLIQSFTVYLFNSTNPIVAANTLAFPFATSGPAEITVPPNGTYTGVFEGNIPFTFDNSQNIFSSIFQLQYQFQYSSLTNQSRTFNLNSPFNYSLNSIQPPYTPPDFIVWAWWAINLVIVVQFIFAWYGNRKLNKQQEAKK